MRRCAGLSLVELMIASTLGLVVVAAAGQLLHTGANTWRQDERQARLRDELRYALAQLGQDLEMAGFYGEAPDPARIRVAAGLAPADGGDCGPAGEAADWLFQQRAASIFTRGDASPEQAHAAFPCISAADFHAGPRGEGTDIVAIKRAGPSLQASARVTGHVYLQTAGPQSVLYRYSPGGAAPPAGSLTYEYQPAVWYLRRWSVSPGESPRLPSLCRKVLGAGLRMQGDPGGCIAQGIEDLQLEFGMDRNRDGVADVYGALGAIADTTVLASIVSVRVTLLAHTAEGGVSYIGSRLALLRNPANLRAPRELAP